jgi:nicotinamide-nucleotide amidase
LLEERGPVDPDVAVALAAGARERLSASWALGLTGVAGPDPQDGAAVGTVYVGIAGPDRAATAAALSLAGDRQAIRDAAVDAALRLLRDSLAAAEYRG